MKSNVKKKSSKESLLEKKAMKSQFSSCRKQYLAVKTTDDYIGKIMTNDISEMKNIIPDEQKGIVELSMNNCNKIEEIIIDFAEFQTKHHRGNNLYEKKCTEALKNIQDIKQQIQDEGVEDDNQKFTFEQKTVKPLRFFTYLALVKSSESLQRLNNENKKEEEKKEDKKESTETDKKKKKKTHRRAKSQGDISDKYDVDKKNVEETVDNDTKKKQKRGQEGVACCGIF